MTGPPAARYAATVEVVVAGIVFNGLVPVGRIVATREPGAWAVRERQGQHAATTLTAAIRYPVVWANQGRVLTAEELLRVYQICAEVRSCVNGIARRIATWDHRVECDLDPKDDGYEAATGAAKAVDAFLRVPNTDKETWQSVITKFVIDLLLYDAGAIEKVRDGFGKLVELVAIRGSDIRPKVDENGHTLDYVQDAGVGSIGDTDDVSRPTFAPDDMIFMRLFPTTAGPEGYPLIECIVTEVITVIRSSDNLMRSVDADELVPGVLSVMGLQGPALDSLAASFQIDKGKATKLRIVSPPPGGGVEWTEMRRTPKEAALIEALDQTRRTIWRAFGVMPIEQGAADGSPRASTETQLDVSQSHLLWPILEAVEQAIDMHVVAELVVDPAVAANLHFRFNRQRQLTPAEREADAKANEVEFRNGALTINEWRKLRGRLPVVGGDASILMTAAGPVRLSDLFVEDTDTDTDTDETEPEPEDDDGVEEPEADAVDPEDDARALATRRGRHHAHHEDGPCPYGVAIRSRLDIPEAWQDSGKFSGRRTLPLRKLGEAVADYATDALTWWADARTAVIAAVRAATADGKLTAEEVASISSKVGSELETLATKWATGSARHYRTAAEIARDAVAEHARTVDPFDPEDVADPYRVKQIGYLGASDGPIAAVRSRVLGAVTHSSLLRTRAVVDDAAKASTAKAVAATLDAVAAAFDTQEHRVTTYAGRLIELANDAFIDGMNAAGAPAGDDGRITEWWYSWDGVGDSVQCSTCAAEQARGFQPLRDLRRRPGGDTQCRSNDRCVIVVWTRDEVDNGSAVRLGS